MEHDEKLIIAERMKLRGGSFAKALAEAMLLADPINLQKIEDTFPEIIEEYRRF